MEHQLQAASPSAVRVRNDLTGQRFGKLTVLEYVKIKNGNSKWKCQCDCGEQIEVRATMLTSGHTTSCGCLKKTILSGAIFQTGRCRESTKAGRDANRRICGSISFGNSVAGRI